MPLKFLRLLTNGNISEEKPIVESTGNTDADKIPVTDATGKLDISLFPTGIDVAAKNTVASETLSAGDFVNLFDDAGTIKARLADAENNRPAVGFVLKNIAANATGLVYSQGINTQLSGLQAGNKYFLSNTPGEVSNTPIIESGDLKAGTFVQVLGIAISGTELRFEFDDPIYVA